jgi:hypothetical protein
MTGLHEAMIRGHRLGKAMLAGDEELGKKDDDHRFAPVRRPGWSIWNHTFRWRRRRMLLVIAGLCILYVLLNSFGTGRGYPLGKPITPGFDPSQTYDDGLEPTGPPPGTQILGDRIPHTFEGRIRFYRLARSLRESASQTNGYDKTNRNVLFAVSSLQSASTLLPMICEMSKWSRSHVHAAFMGREDIPLNDLLDINGVDREKCPTIWHDARPDYMEYSTDARAQSAVISGISHIHNTLHPQAVIMDDSLSEDTFFVRGMRNRTEVLAIPLIEIPKNKWDNFMWITRLDAGSLRNWHLPTVDIMIQVPPESSSVLRLLKSIKDADYSGLKPPRLILELPAKLDESVKRHVDNFKWPPHNTHPLAGSGLVIRRRITNHRATQEDAAIRFLELFYPHSTVNSHVMLLSPQAQLSPLYYHYVQYTLLEYKFSYFGVEDSTKMMGVSLELPSVLLDGKTKLTPPTLGDMNTNRYEKLFPKTLSAPFLWQAPNSHATLFFGDKWAELHSFLSNRVVKHQDSPKTTSRAKLVSETLPAWTEYMLEFMRARSYALLYPAKTSDAFVTVHNELYQSPEEYAVKEDGKDTETVPDMNEPFLRGDTPARPPKNTEAPVIPGAKPLHLALPFEGDLPEIPHLPQLLFDGSKIDAANASQIALDFANRFREEVGGCKIPKGKRRKIVPGEARDLFCFGDEDARDWEDDTPQLQGNIVHEKLMVDDDQDEAPITAFPPTPTREKKVTRPTIEADEF